MTKATKPSSYISKQLAYRFSVSVNSDHAVKRNCLIAGSVLCFDQFNEIKPLIIFLPHFKILYKKIGEHYSIYLNSRVDNYNMKIKLKSKNEAETSNFAAALLVARDMYNRYIPALIGYPVQAKGQNDYIDAILFVFERSFEIQSEDGILLYNESRLPPPDVYPSPTDITKLIVSRDGEIKFDINCVDIIELIYILLELNSFNPAVTTKKSELRAIEQQQQQQLQASTSPQNQSTPVNDQNNDQSVFIDPDVPSIPDIDLDNITGTSQKPVTDVKEDTSVKEKSEKSSKSHKHSKTHAEGEDDTNKKHHHKNKSISSDNLTKLENDKNQSVETLNSTESPSKEKRSKSNDASQTPEKKHHHKSKSPSTDKEKKHHKSSKDKSQSGDKEHKHHHKDKSHNKTMTEENLDGFDISVHKTPSLDDLGTKSPQKSDLPSSQVQKSASLDEISLESNATTEIGPATQPLFFDDEDEMSLAESTTMSTATSVSSIHPKFKLAEPQVAFNPTTGVTIRRLEDFQLQLTNRSAFRHMREGVFKDLFLKNHKSYKVKAEAHQMAAGYTPDEAELSLVPDIHNVNQEKVLDQLSRSKNMTFEEKMQKKLEDDYNIATKVNKFTPENIFAIVTEQYRQKDPVIAANPLPVIDVIPDDEGPIIKFSNNVFTSELFDVKKDSEVYKSKEKFEPKNVKKIYENLVSRGVDFEKCGIKLPQNLQKDIEVLFYELLGRAPDSEFPALLSTVLLHGCNSIQNVYLTLSTLSYTVVEVSNTLLSHPFYDFASCCKFFAKLLNIHCTPYLFSAIDNSLRFKETCYRKDALINLPLFVQAISALSTPSNITLFSMNPPAIYNYVNLSIVIDDLCEQLRTSKIYAFLRPITSTSPMAQLAYTVLYYYDKDFDIQNIGWVFSKIASKHMIFIKYSKIKEMSKLAQIIAFILELILTEKYHLFFLETYIQTQKLIKIKYSVESVVLLIDSLVNLQKILHEDSLPSLVEVSIDIAKLLGSK